MASSIDKYVDDLFGGIGGKVPKEMPPNAPVSIDEHVDQLFEGVIPKVPIPANQPSAMASKWGPGYNFANALTLGYGLPIASGLMAQSQSPEKALPSGKIPTTFGDVYSDLTKAKEAWQIENPGANLTTTALGSLTPLLATGALGGIAAAPLATRIAAMSPLLDASMTAPLAIRLAAGTVNALPRLGAEAVSGASQGAVTGALATPLTGGEPLQNAQTGALFGGALGPLNRLGQRALHLESNINQPTINAAEALRQQGVPIRPGQLPGAGWPLKVIDKVFGNTRKQNEIFNTQLTSKAFKDESGIPQMPSPFIDQKWTSSARDKIGTTMNDLIENKFLPGGPELAHDTAAALQSIPLTMDASAADTVRKLYTNVLRTLGDARTQQGIPGKVYQSLVSSNGMLGKALASKNSDIRNGARELKHILEEEWARTLPPEDLAKWNAARNSYKWVSAIDDSLDKTSQVTGVFNPKALYPNVLARTKNENINLAGDMGDLALGGSFLPNPSAAKAPMTAPKWAGLLGTAGIGMLGGAGILMHEPSREAVYSVMRNPSEVAPTMAMILGGALLGGKAANRLYNRPSNISQWQRATQMGLSRPINPLNPLIPLGMPLAEQLQ